LSKGKGNKIINIAGAQAATGDDLLTWLMILPVGASMTLHFGKRKLKFKAKYLQKYRSELGRKGTSLPRGMHNIKRINICL
ncbi:DNA topoisomerase IV subunit A, partial [Escherichia coli]|nr:DNA topoisomerase IV subunit A [Escherichia coli]